MPTLKALFDVPSREQRYFLRVFFLDGIAYPYFELRTLEYGWKIRTPTGEHPIGKSDILGDSSSGHITIETLSRHVGTSGLIPLPPAQSLQAYDPFSDVANLSPWPLIGRKFLVSTDIG